MRAFSRLLLSAVVLTLLTATALPQKRFCQKPPPSPFKHDGDIVTMFDGRAGGMRTTLEHPRPLGRGTVLYYMAASFMHPSTSRPGTPMLDLILYSTSPTAHLRPGQDLVLLLDGQPRSFSRNVSYKSQGGGNSARITLSYAEASALTHARKVSAQFGGTEVELSNNHLEALRELLSLMAPSPGRWQTADTQSAR
jgi:hypothetical protein